MQTKPYAGTIIVSGGIVLLVLCLYVNVLPGDFIWDDVAFIENNAGFLSRWKSVAESFARPFHGTAPAYRPLLMVSYIIDYKLWGLNPAGYHLTNILLHAAASLLVFRLALTLFASRPAAVWAALLFAAHPLNTQAVAWIGGRNDILMTVFSLLSAGAYCRWRRSGGRSSVLLLGVWTGALWCAMLAKESGVCTALLIILVELYAPRGTQPRAARCAAAGLALLSVVLFLYIRMRVLGSAGMGRVDENITAQLLRVPLVYAYYVKKLFLPVNLTFDPHIPFISSVTDPSLLPAAFILAPATAVALVAERFVRGPAFCLAWIIIALLPVCGGTPLMFAVLEHRAYLGCAGFCVAVSLVMSKPGAAAPLLKTAATALLCLLIILYGIQTFERNSVWKNEQLFWRQAVADSPFSVFSHINCAVQYAAAGRFGDALSMYNEALTVNSRTRIAGPKQRAFQKSFILSRVGMLYARVLQNRRPAGDAQQLIEQLGVDALRKKATACFKKALAAYPHNASAFNGLGDACYRSGDFGQAAFYYEQALSCDPGFAEAYVNLGLLRFDQERYEDAEALFSRAVSIRPTVEALNNLALVHLRMHRYAEALQGFSRLLHLVPHSADIHFNIALVYLQGLKNAEKAAVHLKKCLACNPQKEQAATVRMILEKLGRKPDAG